MKKAISVFLIFSLLLAGCAPSSSSISIESNTAVSSEKEQTENQTESASMEPSKESCLEETAVEETESGAVSIPESPVLSVPMDISGLDDDNLLSYVNDNVYSETLKHLDTDKYYIQSVETIYYPKEYIEALESNSRSNIYFGYTSAELDNYFQGTKYVFTLGDNGETVVMPMETISDDVFVKAMEDVVIGTGVILVCVVISTVAAPAAPAVAVIFAASASSGTAFAVESGALGFATAAIIKGYEAESLEQALKAGVEAGAEGFKWGAIIGATTGGLSEGIGLARATTNGLTMNEVALIQKESKWPLEAIKSLHSKAEYEIYKKANLVPIKLENNQWILYKKIDWDLVDSKGRTNIQRVLKYHLSPVDETGASYQLHHIGMREDSPLAILKYSEHYAKDDYFIIHWRDEGKNIPDSIWAKQREEVWKAVLKYDRGVTSI